MERFNLMSCVGARMLCHIINRMIHRYLSTDFLCLSLSMLNYKRSTENLYLFVDIENIQFIYFHILISSRNSLYQWKFKTINCKNNNTNHTKFLLYHSWYMNIYMCNTSNHYSKILNLHQQIELMINMWLNSS